MLRVLVVDEALPTPPDSGKRIRTCELLRRLASDFRVTLLVPAQTPLGAERLEPLQDAGIEVRSVARPPLSKRGLRFAWDLGRNVFLPVPYIVMAHRVRAVTSALAATVAEQGADLIHVEWTPLAATVPASLDLPVCVSAHNVETLIWERYGEQASDPFRRAYIALQTRKVRRFEARTFKESAHVTAVSEDDASTIRAWAGHDRVTVVPNGVDPDYFLPAPDDAVIPGRLLFVGALDWRPNQDAVLWFLDEVWPRVRHRRPSVTFEVVGRHPPSWLQERLEGQDGVSLAASVPDVRPHLAAADVTVVPLRIGGGSRLKICEAIAAGRPVVSTAVGAEGLEVGDAVVRAPAEAEAFAEATVMALADPGASRQRAVSGRELVLTHHAWDAIAPRQAAAWRAAVEYRA